MSRHLFPGALMSTPSWDRDDEAPYCTNCGREFREHEEQYQDDRDNPLCEKCRGRLGCKVCGGPCEDGDLCSDECALLDAITNEKFLEADHKIRMEKGD